MDGAGVISHTGRAGFIRSYLALTSRTYPGSRSLLPTHSAYLLPTSDRSRPMMQLLQLPMMVQLLQLPLLLCAAPTTSRFARDEHPISSVPSARRQQT